MKAFSACFARFVHMCASWPILLLRKIFIIACNGSTCFNTAARRQDMELSSLTVMLLDRRSKMMRL